MSLPEDDFVEVVGSAEHDEDMPLPVEARLKTVELRAPGIVTLPSPTVAFFTLTQACAAFRRQ